MKLSVVIKSLNEDKVIDSCIKSCLDIKINYNARIILIDSLSTDNTIKIAKKYPIEIYQINDIKLRSYGIAGYFAGKICENDDYVLLIDADQRVNLEGVELALKEFDKNPKIAGVTGIVEDSNQGNNILSRAAQQTTLEKQKTGKLTYLPGAGLYRMGLIKKLDYFMNPFLKSNEEVELGYRILVKNLELRRINKILIYHRRHEGNSFKIMLKNFKSGRYSGPGQTLFYGLKQDFKLFLMHFRRLFLYESLIGWWVLFLCLNLFSFKLFILFNYLSLFLLGLYLIKKKSILIALHQIIIWHLISIGIFQGFFRSNKNPNIIKISSLERIK